MWLALVPGPPRPCFMWLALVPGLLWLSFMSVVYSAETEPVPAAENAWKVYTEWPFSSAEAKRRQEETAKALGIPAAETLDLGNGVSLDLVLIPAGRFIMATPKPEEPEWAALARAIIKAQVMLVLAGSTVLGFVMVVFIRSWRLKRRPQMSLRFFMVLIMALSVCCWGGVGWHQGVKAERDARSAYEAAATRFKQASDYEKPAHGVTISRPFYMGKFEVTQAQYAAVLGSNPSFFKGDVQRPVERVSWDEMQAFCQKLSTSSGRTVRLPTEAEWEYGCRAGTVTQYCSGDADSGLGGVAWYESNSGGTTHAVGKKAANGWGLNDMHGNVWEWCQDWYGELYYRANAVTDPQGPDSGTCRVLRGGSWSFNPQFCRSAYRIYFNPDFRDRSFGFRVVVLASRTP